MIAAALVKSSMNNENKHKTFNKQALMKLVTDPFLNPANRWRSLQSPTQTERERHQGNLLETFSSLLCIDWGAATHF